MSLGTTAKPRTLTMGALALIVAVGCGDFGEPGEPGGDASFGGSGGTAGPNAPNGGGGTEGGGAGAGGAGGEGPGIVDVFDGVISNPVDVLVADPDRSSWDALTITDGGSASDYAATALACFEAPAACGGAACTVFATCCVDNGTCCKAPEFAELPSAIDFPSCAGTDLATCVAPTSASVFGPATLEITNRGLIPDGNASEEGGALIGETVDLAGTRVRVDVEFALPVGCGVSCLESAGVAFTSEAPDAFVNAGLGLLLSGSRDELNLMIGNAVVRSFDPGNDATQWSLIATPDGRVDVLRDDVVQFTASFDPSTLRQARLALFGRNLSEGAKRAAIRTVEFST
ncbi:MAG: hypothetical protein WBG86_10590, partial [Polyangiales bacterium]